MRILVTDGETRAALAVTRSLGIAGHVVHVASSRPTSIAGRSRYAAASHEVDNWRGVATFENSVSGLIERVEPELIVGVTDRSLTVLHRLHDRFPREILAPPTAERYGTASDKVRLFEMCLASGIRVPDGIAVPGGALPDPDAVRTLGDSLVVRPALSWRVDNDRWIEGRVSYEADVAGVEKRLRVDPSLSFPYLVQRKIAGDGCGLFFAAHDGRIVCTFAHRRLREKPPTGGVSTLCESVPPPRDLEEVARRFAAALRWSGLAMLEFKRDRATGEPYLLEVNARPWGSMELARASGVDFPVELVAIATRVARPTARAYRPGVRLRWWWGDVDHFFLCEKSSGRGGATAGLRGFGRAVMAGPWPDAWDTFRADDPMPFALETWSWVRGH